MGTPYLAGGNQRSGTDGSGFTKKLYGSVYHETILRTSRLQAEQIIEAPKVISTREILSFLVGVAARNGIYCTLRMLNWPE